MIWQMLNWYSGLFFGMILIYSFLFSNIQRKQAIALLIFSVLSISVQQYIAVVSSFDIVSKAYPFAVHLPLLLISIFYFKKSVTASLAALLIAFILTVPRNWLGDVAVFCFPSVKNCKDIAKFFVTFPMLWFICRFVSPSIRKNLGRSLRELQLILVPGLLYYIICYAATVYTNLLYSGNIVFFEFILTLVTISLFIYIRIVYRQLSQMIELEQQQALLKLQTTETTKQLEEIRYSQQKTKMIRHDMRHYLQMLDNMLLEDKSDEARSYIRTICNEIDETVIKQFCLNESINLILSSYDGKAKKQEIVFEANCNIPKEPTSYDLDVCIILANGIENAFHAVAGIQCPHVTVDCYFYQGKYVIQIKNPFTDAPQFEGNLPKTAKKGHGLGTVSITAIAQKHGGISKFYVENGVFVLKVMINSTLKNS